MRMTPHRATGYTRKTKTGTLDHDELFRLAHEISLIADYYEPKHLLMDLKRTDIQAGISSLISVAAECGRLFSFFPAR